MYRILVYIICVSSIIGIFFSIGRYMMGKPYSQYSELSYYRRLHPEILSDAKTVRIWVGGHSTTYASLLWIDLIQYIGDNARNNMFLHFLYPISKKINELHPKFTTPYVVATLLAPLADKDNPKYEENMKILEQALEIGESGIEKTCSSEKIEKIKNAEISSTLWENPELKNPCKDGMLPYYIASVAERMGKRKKAEEYFKIASLNDDSPSVSRFLMLLVQAGEGEHLLVAKKFLLIGIGGYDEYPFTCRNTLGEILKEMDNRKITESDITFLKEKELLLTPPKDTKNPLSSSVTSCYESGMRAIKQFYLAYIQEIGKQYPSIDTGSGLIATGALTSIPTLESQKGWNVRKYNNGAWRYTQ